MLKNIHPEKIIFILFIALFSGCTENAPQIKQLFWQLNMVKDVETGREREALTVFVMADDEDGWDDIESIYLINDEEELFWKISKDDMVTKGYGENEVWLGSSSVMMPGESKFPAGNYRLVLIDSMGERDETQVALSNNITSEKQIYPSLKRSGTTLNIEGNADFIWSYTEDNSYFEEYDVKRIPNMSGKKVKDFYLYKYYPEKGYGVITGAFE